MADDVLRVSNSEGRSFNIKLIGLREPDSHTGGGRWQNPTKPVVEIYDAAYEGDHRFGTLGQFAARYYVTDLLEHPKGVGLMLHGGVPAWRLDGPAMAEVQNWLLAKSLEIA